MIKHVLAVGLLLAVSAGAHAGTRLNGVKQNGTHLNGIRANGVFQNGTHVNGTRINGVRFNGIKFNGIRRSGGGAATIEADASAPASGLTVVRVRLR